jgi:hypothetical protein
MRAGACQGLQLEPGTSIRQLLNIFPDEGRHGGTMLCTQPWRTVVFGAHMPFHGRWISRCADVMKVHSVQEMFSKLGYTGAPELFSMWTCLLLDRPAAQTRACGLAATACQPLINAPGLGCILSGQGHSETGPSRNQADAASPSREPVPASV